MLMENKSSLTEAKDLVVDAAKSGLDGVKDVAGEAIGAAAAAAAGVVIVRAAEALLTSGEELKAAAPAVSVAAKETAAAPFTSTPTKPRRKARSMAVGHSPAKTKAKSGTSSNKK
jgi:hypothetical protein